MSVKLELCARWWRVSSVGVCWRRRRVCGVCVICACCGGARRSVRSSCARAARRVAWRCALAVPVGAPWRLGRRACHTSHRYRCQPQLTRVAWARSCVCVCVACAVRVCPCLPHTPRSTHRPQTTVNRTRGSDATLRCRCEHLSRERVCRLHARSLCVRALYAVRGRVSGLSRVRRR